MSAPTCDLLLSLLLQAGVHRATKETRIGSKARMRLNEKAQAQPPEAGVAGHDDGRVFIIGQLPGAAVVAVSIWFCDSMVFLKQNDWCLDLAGPL